MRVSVTPEVVVVEVDGGRLRTRSGGCGPGVHEVQNKEDKVARLVTLKSHAVLALRPTTRTSAIVSRAAGSRASPGDSDERVGGENSHISSKIQPKTRNRCRNSRRRKRLRTTPPVQRRLVRTRVASMADSRAFGPAMAAEAQERGFYQAKRKAFVADEAHRATGVFTDGTFLQ